MSFKSFNNDIIYTFTNRLNGCSEAPFESFNLAFHVGDSSEHVEQNRNRLRKDYFDGAPIQAMNQIHSDRICTIDSDRSIEACDALITQQKRRVLMVMVADCIPLLLYDAKQKIIAAVHAGRAGAFANIAGKTVEKMQKAYGSNTRHMYALLGPSIGSCCYEVGTDIRDEAVHLGYLDAIKMKNSRYYLDIQSIVEKQLAESGLALEHIENEDICTACHTQNYFSYRKEGKTGRFCGAIMLK